MKGSRSRRGVLGAAVARIRLNHAHAQQRAVVWPRLCAANRFLAPLQLKAGREFPVVELEPLETRCTR
jgi:hypothetical protein